MKRFYHHIGLTIWTKWCITTLFILLAVLCNCSHRTTTPLKRSTKRLQPVVSLLGSNTLQLDYILVSLLTSLAAMTDSGIGARRFLAIDDPTSQPSSQPSLRPSTAPSAQPTAQPTSDPSAQPSRQPSSRPSTRPTFRPSSQPTIQPSGNPSEQPTVIPSSQPSSQPTKQPSSRPTAQPSCQPSQRPSAQPTAVPSAQPSCQPSSSPTAQPSVQPSARPTGQPTSCPSGQPSAQPSSGPTSQPISVPTAQPSSQPSSFPTSQPSAQPSEEPTSQPTAAPTTQPSTQPSSRPSSQPVSGPTSQPSRQPTAYPSGQPSERPSAQPTTQPTMKPTGQPSVQPSSCPSAQPTVHPSTQPTAQPSGVPTGQPTIKPSALPSGQPTSAPTAQPSTQPSAMPTMQPSAQPSAEPTSQPTAIPTAQPSGQPSMQPSTQPSAHPTAQPSQQPSSVPSGQPTVQPSGQPSTQPTTQPSLQPTAQQSRQPSSQPTTSPSTQPSAQPSSVPSLQPTAQPSTQPSMQPSAAPSSQPTVQPTCQPTAQPSTQPTGQPSSGPTVQPSCQPSTQPTLQPSAQPTSSPSRQPTSRPTSQPSAQPTGQPSTQPSGQPSALPTMQPTMQPTAQPSSQPSTVPSTQPTTQPSAGPSAQPSAQPTLEPSGQPTMQPSVQPSSQPTQQPSSQPSTQPTAVPSAQPTLQPTLQPTVQPSAIPTVQPTMQPTATPSSQPSAQPTGEPSAQPTTQPSVQPTVQPSAQPSIQPSGAPSSQPSSQPSGQPSVQPSTQPSSSPSTQPSTQPSVQPTSQPSGRPSVQPTALPSSQPSIQPSAQPTSQPTVEPTAQPTRQPSSQPSAQPSTQPSSQPTQPTSQPSMQPSSQPTSQPTVLMYVLDVNLRVSSLYSGRSTLGAVVVSWTDMPGDEVILSLSFAALNETTASVDPPTVYPSRMTLSGASPGSGEEHFTVIAGQSTGLFTLVLDLTGPSLWQYRTAVLGYDTLRVLASGTAPPVPAPRSATFTFDGTAVLVVFDTPTNRAGDTTEFPCTQLFTFSGSEYARCQWRDSATAVIYPRYLSSAPDSVLEVGSAVTVLGGRIRAACDADYLTPGLDCSTFSTVGEMVLTVMAPPTPAFPIAALSMPSVASACAPLTIDLTASAGAAGRPWARVSFDVSATNMASARAGALQAHLNANYSTTRPFTIPPSLLAPSAMVSVQVTLCNFLLACHFAAKTVTMSDSLDPLPVVTILGSGRRTVTRSAALVLNAAAKVQGCDGSVTTQGLSYAWTALPGTANTNTTAVRSVSPDPAVFRINPFTLRSGVEYVVAVTVTSLATESSASDQVVVFVKAADIIARLRGGLVTPVSAGTSVLLDASTSVDPDLPTLTGAAAGLQFTWTCAQKHPTYSVDCAISLDNVDYPDRRNVTAPPSAVNTTSRVTVTVYDASRSRSSVAYTDILVSASPPAELTITTASTGQSANSIDTGKALTLRGTVRTPQSCTAIWTVDNPDLVLSKSSLSTTATVVPAASTSATSVNLVLAPHTLPQGALLAFTLACGASYTSVVVTTNSAPRPGEFVVEPSAGGVELMTVFTFSAPQWSDTDLPITYQFGFVAGGGTQSAVVVARSQVMVVTSLLPAGRSLEQYRVNCTLQVFDSMGAYASASTLVEVSPAAQSHPERQQLALTLLESTARDTATGAELTSLISLVSAVVNAVNCTAASNCTVLHRLPCSDTDGQCGVCMAGYIGDSSDRTSACVAVASLVVDNSSAPISCTADDHCQSYQLCNFVTHACETRVKQCARNCSAHGTCSFVSAITGQSLPSAQCSIANPRCIAVCTCEVGYSGSACEMSTSTLQLRRTLRSRVIDTLKNLTAVQDVSTETLTARANSLYALVQKPYELSVSDASRLLEIANTTLTQAQALQLDTPTELLSVLRVVDALTSVAQSSYNPHDYGSLDTSSGSESGITAGTLPVIGVPTIVQVTQAFAGLVEGTMALGQREQVFEFDSFRLAVAKHSLTADHPAVTEGRRRNITVYSPQSQYEVITQQAPVTATLQLRDGASGELAVKALMVYPRAYGTSAAVAFLSHPLYLQLTSDNPSAVATTALSAVDLSFPFHAPVVRYAQPPVVQNVTTVCTADRGPGRPGGYNVVDVYHTCEESGMIIHHNCTGLRAMLTSYCPVLKPTCAAVDVYTGGVQTVAACRVVRFNTTITQCECAVPAYGADSNGRRRLAGTTALISAAGVSNMVATSDFVAADETDTFQEIVRPLLDTDIEGSYVVVYLLSALYGGGLLILCVSLYDHHRGNSNKEAGKTSPTGTAVDDVESSATSQQLQDTLLRYVWSTIPMALRPQPESQSYGRMVTYLLQCHTYLSLCTKATTPAKATLYGRSVAIFRLVTMQTYFAFILALLYDRNSPDRDNSCDTYSAEAACLEQRRHFDPTQSVCSWDYVAYNFRYECRFHEKYTHPTGFVYMMALAAVTWMVFAVLPDMLFAVLRAPLMRDGRVDPVATMENAEVAGVQGKAVEAGDGSSVDGAQLKHQQPDLPSAVRAGGTGVDGDKLAPHQDTILARSQMLKLCHSLCARAMAWQGFQDRVQEDLKAQAERVRTRRFAVTQDTAAVGTTVGGDGDWDAVVGPDSEVERPEAKWAQAASVAPRGHRRSLSEHSETALFAFCDELTAQRLVLVTDTEETRQFEHAWGLFPNTVSAGHAQTYSVRADVKLTLFDAVTKAQTGAAEEQAALLAGSPSAAGMMLLHSFVADLLGRDSRPAQIFQTSIKLVYGQSTAVSTDFKIFSALLLCALNAFFTYYTVWIASHKGHKWQLCYVVAVLAQIAVEVLISETAISATLYWVLPSLARERVAAAMETVTQLVSNLCAECLPHSPEELAEAHPEMLRYFVDAPRYLFVSHKLAQSRPELTESLLILRHSSPWPGPSAESWPHLQAAPLVPEESEGGEQQPVGRAVDGESELATDVGARENEREGRKKGTLVSILLTGGRNIESLCTWVTARARDFATMTPYLQLLLLRLLVTVVLFSIVHFALAASYSIIALALLMLVLAGLLCAAVWYAAYLAYLAALQRRRIAPQTDVAQSAEADVIEDTAESNQHLVASAEKSMLVKSESDSDSSTDMDVEDTPLDGDSKDPHPGLGLGSTVFRFSCSAMEVVPAGTVETDDCTDPAVNLMEVVGSVAKEVTTEATASAQGAVQCLTMLTHYRQPFIVPQGHSNEEQSDPPQQPVEAEPTIRVHKQQQVAAEHTELQEDSEGVDDPTAMPADCFDYSTAAPPVSRILDRSALMVRRSVVDHRPQQSDMVGVSESGGEGLHRFEPTGLPDAVSDGDSGAGESRRTTAVARDRHANGVPDDDPPHSYDESGQEDLTGFGEDAEAGGLSTINTASDGAVVSSTDSHHHDHSGAPTSDPALAQADWGGLSDVSPEQLVSQQAEAYVSDTLQTASQRLMTRTMLLAAEGLASHLAETCVDDALTTVSQRLVVRAVSASLADQQQAPRPAEAFVSDTLNSASQRLVTRLLSAKERSRQAALYVEDTLSTVSQRLSGVMARGADGDAEGPEEGSVSDGDEAELDHEYKAFDSVFSNSDGDNHSRTNDAVDGDVWEAKVEEPEYRAFESVFEDDADGSGSDIGAAVAEYQAFDSVFEGYESDEAKERENTGLQDGTEWISRGMSGRGARYHSSGDSSDDKSWTATAEEVRSAVAVPARPVPAVDQRQPSVQEWRTVLSAYGSGDSDDGP